MHILPVYLANLGAAGEATDAVETMFSALNNLDLERILRIVILLAICLVVSRILLRLVDRAFRRLEVERGTRTFVRSALRAFLWLITITLILRSLNVEITSLIAVLSLAGLAVSLAIQGILSNLAGGIMVLISKPFKTDDFIETGSLTGTVVEVGLVYTKLCTLDNKVIAIPNGTISGQTIINYSAQGLRRVDLTVSATYEDPPEAVIACIGRVIEAHPKALPDPEPFVRLSGYQDSGIEYTLRVWCATPDYWDVYFDLLGQIKPAFDEAGISIPYPHMDVQLRERKH